MHELRARNVVGFSAFANSENIEILSKTLLFPEEFGPVNNVMRARLTTRTDGGQKNSQKRYVKELA